MKTKANTTRSGVLDEQDQANSTYESTDDGADALMNRWAADESPSAQGEEEVVEEKEAEEAPNDEAEEQQDPEAEEADESDESQEQEEGSDEATEENEESEVDESEDKKTPKKVLSDDDEIEIIVDKEARKVAVKDLKRLYGQEAALTKKSQQVAAQRKEVEATAVKQAAVLDSLYKKAAAKWEPFSKVDMLIASKELNVDQFQVLRKEAQEAYEEFQFVSTEADQFVKQADAQRQETLKTKAAEAVTVLKEKIPNWSDELYNKIRKFAVDNGFDPVITSQIVDPAAIMMINKARLYDEGKKVTLKKKVMVPTKVIKSGNADSSNFTVDKRQASMQKLRNSGDAEDAAEAFLSRWAQ